MSLIHGKKKAGVRQLEQPTFIRISVYQLVSREPVVCHMLAGNYDVYYRA